MRSGPGNGNKRRGSRHLPSLAIDERGKAEGISELGKLALRVPPLSARPRWPHCEAERPPHGCHALLDYERSRPHEHKAAASHRRSPAVLLPRRPRQCVDAMTTLGDLCKISPYELSKSIVETYGSFEAYETHLFRKSVERNKALREQVRAKKKEI